MFFRKKKSPESKHLSAAASTEGEIKKVAVLGSGVMGSGIAAQVANAGLPVLLLDIVPPDLAKFNGDRNAFAKGAVEKLLKADPAPFMTKRAAKLITIGNMDDDLDKLKDCDLIIEVVLEDLNIKHNRFFEHIDDPAT